MTDISAKSSFAGFQNYEAIIFDLDGTLTNTRNYPIKASKWLFEKLELHSDSLFEKYLSVLVRHYFRQIKAIASGSPYRRPLAIVSQSIATALSEVGIEPDAQLVSEAADQFSRLHIELSELYPGTMDLLNWLREQDIRIGVITNSFEGNINIILRRLGLDEFVEVKADGSIVKTYKPDPRAFLYLSEKLEVPPRKALVVGDEYFADIVGAHRAGMNAVWINLRKHSLDDYLNRYGPETAPVLVIYAISELAQYIA